MGTSSPYFSRIGSARDHPHACGDKRYEFFTTDNATGSSPRVWGQEAYFDKAFNAARIIPTRVGTRLCLGASLLSFQDHPHACGDKMVFSFLPYGLSGSSPRVWGQVRLSYPDKFSGGIIPTRVGTSFSRLSIRSARRDHPHACGDKYNHNNTAKYICGSSPRVWGQD